MNLAPLGVLVGTCFFQRSFLAGHSFLFRVVQASLLGTLALLSVAIQELVGQSRGRPLVVFPVATGLHLALVVSLMLWLPSAFSVWGVVRRLVLSGDS